MPGFSWLRALTEALVEGLARAFGRRRSTLPAPEDHGQAPPGPEGLVGPDPAPGVETEHTALHKGPIHRRMMGGRR